MLLFGRFDYQDRGILDRTHLRFYTFSSFNALLQTAACRVGRCCADAVACATGFSVDAEPHCRANSRDTFRYG